MEKRVLLFLSEQGLGARVAQTCFLVGKVPFIIPSAFYLRNWLASSRQFLSFVPLPLHRL